MSEDWDIWECERGHGEDRHVMVHEAGHAIAAIDYGMPFECVRLFGPEGDPSAPGLWTAVGRVVMVNDADPSSWVSPDPISATRFAYAGTYAEEAVLTDFSSDAYKSDVETLRRGLGPLHEVTADELDSMIGKPLVEIQSETLTWAQANVDRIASLADFLGDKPRPAVITYDDVVDHVEK